MVILVAKINKLYSKLENLHLHHHHDHGHDHLEVFLSDVSNCLTKFSSLSSLESSKTMSLSSIRKCFELIPTTNKAFAKLVVAIDHPMRKWKASSVEEYLNYSLNLLELFNLITSSLSHLGQAKLPLSHGLNLEEEKNTNSSTLALKYLKPIQPVILKKKLKRERERNEEGKLGGGSCCSSKEEVIHKALMVMESLGFWVCGVVLSCLSGGDCINNTNPKEKDEIMSKFGGGFLDSSVFEAVVEIKEVKEVNESVACLVAAIGKGKSSDEAEELRRRLEVLEKVLECFGNEVDLLFNEVLSGRNQLLNGLQQRKE